MFTIVIFSYKNDLDNEIKNERINKQTNKRALSEGDIVPFRDATRHKYPIKMSKQHNILFWRERQTHLWKFWIRSG